MALIKKTDLVVKSNRLIEASYRLTLNEQRIILYAICRCRGVSLLECILQWNF